MLRDGDLLSIDIGTTFERYVSDSAATIAIGKVSAAAERLMRRDPGVPDARNRADAAREPSFGDIGHAVQRHAEAHGYGVVRALVGHGVGRRMHEEPQVPNYGEPGRGIVLRPGLCLAIEPMITEGTYEVRP